MPALGATRATPRSAHRLVGLILLFATLLAAPVSHAVKIPPERGPVTSRYTNVGIIGVTVTNLGYVGNGFNNPNQPSGEYPLNSNVEHLYLGGLWVGAVTPDGTIHVSTGMQDSASQAAGDDTREFQNYENPDDQDDPENFLYQWSNSQNDDNFDPRALATYQLVAYLDDYINVESGSHVPLGLKVIQRTLAWSARYADDFVILDFAIINISGAELRDVYVGFWNDTTVGNTENTNPYDPNAPVGWNFYDDRNGGWGPEEWVGGDFSVPGDPGIWMMYEHDDDGDEGLATSWIGNRFLGARPAITPVPGEPPVSYNAWLYRHVPEHDDAYIDDEDFEQPGKYQVMSNGAFTAGVTQEGDYTIPSNWVALLSTGPWPSFAPNDTIHVTYAITCGADSLNLLDNSRVAQLAYSNGFALPTGPPSPRITPEYEWNTIKLHWAPGDSVDADGHGLPIDDARRQPEYHISGVSGKRDFQGYRVYRFQGLTPSDDPYEEATLVAEFDIIDGVGFDTGLPPLNADGRREFVDTNLLDGYPYWFSVVSFSAPDPENSLPEFESGYNENARLVYPGPGAPASATEGAVTVAPNPYRAGSYFDNPAADEVELGRKIWFMNLPARCTVKVFTVAGDLVKTMHHDDPLDGKLAWDVLSDYERAIATGLYVYVVENLDSGEVQRGKLVIIK